jgi:hypothetical protein
MIDFLAVRVPADGPQRIGKAGRTLAHQPHISGFRVRTTFLRGHPTSQSVSNNRGG